MKLNKLVYLILVASLFLIFACSTTGKNNNEAISQNDAHTERFAIVIGNSNYENVFKLQNAKNDAEDVTVILKQLGYHVDSYYDLNYEQMRIAINKFIETLSKNKDSEGFFYFAGQGGMINNRNYLFPTDVPGSYADRVIDGSYNLDILLNNLIQSDNKLNVVIMDACFSEIFSTHRGLVFASPDDIAINNDGLDVLEYFTNDIFYIQAALPGGVAMDGVSGSRNSPFTMSLLNNIMKPLNFTLLAQEIIKETLGYTDGKQRPYYKANIINYENYIINR